MGAGVDVSAAAGVTLGGTGVAVDGTGVAVAIAVGSVVAQAEIAISTLIKMMIDL